MFGKEQPHINNEDDVGDLIKEIHNKEQITLEVQENVMVRDSKEPTSRTQDKS
jgi:hypothetical protein